MTDLAPPEGGSPFEAMPPEMAANPQPFYDMIRADAPALAMGDMVALFSKEAIDECLRNPELFSSNMSAVDLANIRPLIPLQIDPPEHKNYRKLLDPIFAPKRMLAREEELTALVNEMIDEFADQEEINFAEAFSIPFPSRVFLKLLGLPYEDLDTFLRMKDGIIRPNDVLGVPYGSDEMREYQYGISAEIYAYFNKVLDEREQQREDDLLSLFIDAEVDGDRLTREDILDICYLFLIAGLDTVTSTLDCMFGYFVTHPEVRDMIVADPDKIPAVIEELLRWETPVMGVARAATQDTEIAGCPIKAGQQVFALLGSGNVDPAEFEDSNEVRFDRENNRHIAFGGGVHRCLGSHLARLELRVALREFHRRFPNYSLKEGAELVYTPAIRSIENFPMVLGPKG